MHTGWRRQCQRQSRRRRRRGRRASMFIIDGHHLCRAAPAATNFAVLNCDGRHYGHNGGHLGAARSGHFKQLSREEEGGESLKEGESRSRLARSLTCFASRYV